MGTRNPRYRRPFIWQDEMAEVKNLFKKVAKVKQGGFSGFSVWKDEPTAETLSRNRLRKRRCQYAVGLNHLNYAESPFEAQNHLNNIRGMCARIQRQGKFVERKKKDWDLELHPALLRRPVTVSCSWPKDPNERLVYKPSRPGSAPEGSLGDVPFHYTPSKPTVLFDATHRCPRYREVRHSSSQSQKSGRGSASSLRAMAMADQYNYDWEAHSKGSASPAGVSSLSNGMPSPVSSMMYYNPGPALSSPSSGKQKNYLSHGKYQLEEQISNREVTVRNGEYASLDSTYGGYVSDVERASRTDVSSRASTLNPSDVDTTSTPAFSSSRPSSMERHPERPPSRMMSKRPITTPGTNPKLLQESSHRFSNGDPIGNNDSFDPDFFKEATSRTNHSLHPNGGYSSSNIQLGSWHGRSRDSAGTVEVFSNHTSGAPAMVSDSPAELLRPSHEQQARCSAPRGGESLSQASAKHKNSRQPGDGSSGLWALKQEHQRPFSAFASTSQDTSRLTYGKENEDGVADDRPSTSPGKPRAHAHAHVCASDPLCRRDESPAQARAQTQHAKLPSDPGANSIFTREEEQEVKALQRDLHQGHNKVTSLEHGRPKSVSMLSSLPKEQEFLSCKRQGALAPAAAPQVQERDQQGENFLPVRCSSQQQSGAPPGANSSLSNQPSSGVNKQGGLVDMAPSAGGSAGDNKDSHVMIKHSTEPYVDFKNSMLRMIHEENLYDKQWELEELFQYYVDLNPVVHHEVLKIVISDIRTDMAAQRVKSL